MRETIADIISRLGEFRFVEHSIFDEEQCRSFGKSSRFIFTKFLFFSIEVSHEFAGHHFVYQIGKKYLKYMGTKPVSEETITCDRKYKKSNLAKKNSSVSNECQFDARRPRRTRNARNEKSLGNESPSVETRHQRWSYVELKRNGPRLPDPGVIRQACIWPFLLVSVFCR